MNHHAEASEHDDHGDSHGHHAIDTEHLKPAIGIDPKTNSTSFQHPDGGIITYLNEDLPEAMRRVRDWNEATREGRVYKPQLEHDEELEAPIPTIQATDEVSEGIAAGLYDIVLPEVKPSEDFKKAITERRKEAEKEVRDAYFGLGRSAEVIADKKADYAAVQKRYKLPESQQAVTFHGEDGRNIKDQLVANAVAIEASHQAKQEALAAGKSIDEAFTIGADVYKGLNKSEEPSSPEPQPAPTPPEPQPVPQPEPGTPPQPGPGKEKLTPEERREELKAKQEALKKWFRKVGHNALVAKKTVNQIGLGNIIHFRLDKATDTLLETGQKVVDSIEQSPDRLVKQFKAALEVFKRGGQQFKTAWIEGYAKARERKEARREERDRLSPDEQAIIDARAKEIFKFLSEKHPDKTFGPTSET